jgi:hypothetical protein
VQWQRDDGYYVSDDPSRLDVHSIHRWLSDESYWASGRPEDVVKKSIERSIPLGCFNPAHEQVAFARWVTDGATFGWLCDVFVERRSRGGGLGKFVVQCAVDHPEVRDVRLLLLATRDAHEIYRGAGFEIVAESGRWMELRR